MEGPQIRIYRDRLRRLAGRPIVAVAGERAAAAEPFVGRPLPRAQSRGKLLYLRFGAEALRIHCLMFGDVRVNESRAGGGACRRAAPAPAVVRRPRAGAVARRWSGAVRLGPGAAPPPGLGGGCACVVRPRGGMLLPPSLPLPHHISPTLPPSPIFPI